MKLRVFILSLLCLVVLVACGGNGGTASGDPVQVDVVIPSETAEQPLATQTDGSAPVAQLVETRAAEAASGQDLVAQMPAYGTLVASSTEDPNRSLVFDSVRLTRYGGVEGSVPLDVQVFSDGRYIRNGVQGVVTQALVTQIDNTLDEINFYGLQSVMMSLNPDSSNAKYELRVIRGADDRAINSEEGFMPSEYMVLLGIISSVGQ